MFFYLSKAIRQGWPEDKQFRKHLLKFKIIKKAAFLLLFFLLAALTSEAQKADSIPKDTLVVLGGKTVETQELEMTKNAFLKTGGIDVNQKGCAVEQYTYSMFALGNNIRETVHDSLFPQKLKNAVLNKSINYRYINIEGIIIRYNDDKRTAPDIDTIKVKFIYP